MGSIACVVGPFALKRGLLFSPNEPPIAYTPALLTPVCCFDWWHLRGGFERGAEVDLNEIESTEALIVDVQFNLNTRTWLPVLF
ncbi:hypothetical protein ACUNIZ_06400 [Serratia sp. IR-2025]